jgi:Mrp family chromosome partitioning ATPase
MDKLEKALERARLERQNALGSGSDSAPADQQAVQGAPASPTGDTTSRSRIAILDEKTLRENRLIGGTRGDPNAEAFKVLRTKVLRMLDKHKLRTLAITSPHYGDGKTTVAVNLALSLALDVNQTVCLVDLDLRRPKINEYLGIHSSRGLDGYLLSDVPLSECLVRPSIERLVILPVANAVQDSAETIGLPKMAALALELKTRYPDRIVIYDMPPLLDQADTIAFLKNVDGVLLVVREGVTHAEDVREALHLLADSAVIGTVLNGAAERGYNRE